MATRAKQTDGISMLSTADDRTTSTFMSLPGFASVV